MIRIRSVNGDIEEIVEEGRFVELCDLEGKVAMVFFLNESGFIQTIKSGEVNKMIRYHNAFKDVEWVPIVDLHLGGNERKGH